MNITSPIIVSGYSRSGTSCMMSQIAAALGEERIVGKQWPQLGALQKLEKRPDETGFAHEYRSYIFNRDEREKVEEKYEHSQDANEGGFYECQWTVPGISWQIGIEEIFGQSKPKAIKVVCQGLRKTNPDFVGKVIFMLRHPGEIAQSFERIGNGKQTGDQSEREALKSPMPGNWIDTMGDMAVWAERYHPDCIMLPFADMIESPDRCMGDVQEFIGEGDFSQHTITAKNYRAKWTPPSDDPVWSIADRMFNELLMMNWRKVQELRVAADKEMFRERTCWRCARCNSMVRYHDCLRCYAGEAIRSGFRQNAEDFSIDWSNEPCGFECAYGEVKDLRGGRHLTVQESVDNNFWCDDEQG